MGAIPERAGEQGLTMGRLPVVHREHCLHCGRPVIQGQPLTLSKLTTTNGTVVPGLSHQDCHDRTVAA